MKRNPFIIHLQEICLCRYDSVIKIMNVNEGLNCWTELTKEEHDSGTGVVGVLPGYEGRHHEPQQGREDRHHCQGRDGSEEDCQLPRHLMLI